MNVVASAEVDRRGQCLRLRLTRDGLAAVLAELETLGFAAAPATAAPTEDEWYDVTRVHELSKIEARVIADRVVPPFASAHGVDARRLTEMVADALYRCFAGYSEARDAPLGALRTTCVIAVEVVTRDLLGPETAVGLGRAIDADLRGSPG